MKETIYVVVPAYNVEKYLETTFNSLINQTYSDWICLCMNDGSTDKTWDVMQKYAQMDNRFKVFTQENQGVTKTLNILLDKVNGPYLYYLDSDDCIHPKTFETLLSVLQKTNSDVVECGMTRSYSEMLNTHIDKIEDVSYTELTDMDIFLSVAKTSLLLMSLFLISDAFLTLSGVSARPVDIHFFSPFLTPSFTLFWVITIYR